MLRSLVGSELCIRDSGKGIHIYDNERFENPINLGFLNIPGNYDLAIQNNVLYADNSNDILSFDISDIRNPVLQNINEDVYENNFGDQNLVLLYYNEIERVEVNDCESYGRWYKNGGDIFTLENIAFDQNTSSPNGTGSPESAIGIGGSFARFTIANNHLYTVSNFNLSSFDLSNQTSPSLKSAIDLGWGVETIFPLKNNLFIGTDSGLYIYNIDNPDEPAFRSRFEHARACDPVFVEGDIAYVTLRNGNQCAGFVNQLDIINVSDITNPNLIATHDMINPHGLSVRDGKILLCEGASGMKIIDATDAHDIEVEKHIKDFDAYDIISLNPNHFMLIGADGFYQYEFSEEQEPILLSHIQTVQ